MKKYLLLIAFGLLAGPSSLPAQILTGFGTSETNPLVNLPSPTGSIVAPWTGTQTTTNFSVSSVSAAFGGIQEAFGAPVPVTEPLNNLTLTGALAADPSGTQNFTIVLYDASFNDTRSYQFEWNEFTSGGNSFTGAFDASSGSFAGGVGGWELELGGSPTDTVSYTFTSLALTAEFVPEPSTYAMFGFGLFMLYFVYRRKARQA